MKAYPYRLSILALLATIALPGVRAQNTKIYSTANASASFFSEAPLENIEASTGSARAALNTETGELMFVVPIASFKFDKSLMQQHFNEQYMESERFPEARFEGKIMDWKGKPEGKTEVSVRGNLTIHGVTRQVSEKATLEPSGGGIHGKSTFTVSLKEYNIRIPRMVIKNIAEVVKVNISSEFKPL